MARVRQGSARDGSQGKRPQSLNPSLELTLKLVYCIVFNPQEAPDDFSDGFDDVEEYCLLVNC